MIARLLLALLVTGLSGRGGSLTLSKAFVEKVKNSAVIDTSFQVDHTLSKPHSISSGGNDGDIHSAGRDDTIRLPLVVEITNAGMPAQKPAMDAMNAALGGNRIPLSGVWRLWFEHAGSKPQIQGKPVPKPTGTNPDHVFEIHPVTKVNGRDCMKSFQPIPKYQAYSAERAFGSYEKLTCTIRASSTGIEIVTPQAGFNHTQFRIHPVSKPKKGSGGAIFVLADVHDIDDEEEKVNSSPIRMVFLEGTAAATAVAALGPGDRMNLLGIPRVDLNKVSALVKNLAPTKKFTGALPYEIIVVAQLPEQE